jgi:hypothetical protein
MAREIFSAVWRTWAAHVLSRRSEGADTESPAMSLPSSLKMPAPMQETPFSAS